jgi:hypothetical protein
MTMTLTTSVGGSGYGAQGWATKVERVSLLGGGWVITGDPCPAGFEGSGVICTNSIMTGCSPCGPNTYKASGGRGVFTTCAAGSTTNGLTGQARCVCAARFGGAWGCQHRVRGMWLGQLQGRGQQHRLHDLRWRVDDRRRHGPDGLHVRRKVQRRMEDRQHRLHGVPCLQLQDRG